MSPCTKVCKYDPSGVYCQGCFRTPSEITSWMYYDETEKARVTAMCEVRKLAYKVDNDAAKKHISNSK
jgi:uncharacterized protein